MGSKRARKTQKRKAKKKGAVRRASQTPYLDGSAPVVLCQVSESWHDRDNLAAVVLVRGGIFQVDAAAFLIDRTCLGVWDVEVLPGIPRRDVDEWIESMSATTVFEDVEVGLAAALVTEAVRYAQSLGFSPPKAYPRARSIFGDEKPTEDQLALATPGGPDGRPVYVEREGQNAQRILRRLERAVGPDGFTYLPHLESEDAIAEAFIEGPLGSLHSVDDISIEPPPKSPALERRLVRMGEIKRALILYARSRELELDRAEFLEPDAHFELLRSAGEDAALDVFIHEAGTEPSVIDRFVSEFGDRLSDREVDALCEWHQRFTTCLEVVQVHKDHILAVDLATDETVKLRSDLGATWLETYGELDLLVGSFVPFEDGLLVSVRLGRPPLAERPEVLFELARMCFRDPSFLLRSPKLLEASWESQALHHQAFVDEFGDAVVRMAGASAEEALHRVLVRFQRASGRTVEARNAPPPRLGLPFELTSATEVWLLSDPRYGAQVSLEYGQLEARLKDPAPFTVGEPVGGMLLEMLLESEVDPAPLIIACNRDTAGADRLFGTMLHAEFDWAADGVSFAEERFWGRGNPGPLPSIVTLTSKLSKALNERAP